MPRVQANISTYLQTDDEVGDAVLRIRQLAEGEESRDQQVGDDEEPQTEAAEQEPAADGGKCGSWA